jgi:hypothetical protein
VHQPGRLDLEDLRSGRVAVKYQVTGDVGGGRAGRDRVEQRGADRSAELLPGVDRGGGDARVVGRDPVRAGVQRRREHTAHADTGDHQRPKEVGRVVTVQADTRQPDLRAGQRQHADDDDWLGPDPRHQDDVAHVGGDRDAPHQRQEGHTGQHRRVPEGPLHVVGEEQEDAEYAGPGDQDGDVRAAAVAVEHHPGWQQRVRGTALPVPEGEEQQRSGRQESPRRGGGPVVRRGVGKPVDQAEDPARDQQDARDVELGGRRCLRLPAQQHGAADDRRPGEEQVDVEAPAPGQVRGERAAEQQPDRGARTRDRAVDPEGLAPLLGVAERRGQQRQRGRREHRGEHALAGTGGDQHGEVDRRAADRRGHGEADQAGEEHDLAADQVGQPAAEQQQAAERQRVGGHDPLPVDVVEVQRVLRRRQCQVHHGQVEDDHELRDADYDEDPPAPRVGPRVPARPRAPRALAPFPRTRRGYACLRHMEPAYLEVVAPLSELA